MKLFKSHPELITIPLAVVVWIISIYALRSIDPTSGVFDAGIFQIPLFAIFQLLVYVSVAWILLGLVFGTFKKYLKKEMKTDFQHLSKWQKIKLSYSVFFGLLALLAYLAKTLVTG